MCCSSTPASILPGHIEKIIDTYQYRKEEDRYARRVSMAEIETNDYNLNISRYISTAEPEEQIDLPTNHEEMVTLEKNIAQAANKHNGFLAELGLPHLPG